MDLKSGLVFAALVQAPAITGTGLAWDNPQMPRDLFDFQVAESTAVWSAIDDAVMGAISSSRLRHDPAGNAVFEGVSLDNNGGFASVRSRPGDLGAPGVVSYVLEVRGAGDGFDGANDQARWRRCTTSGRR